MAPLSNRTHQGSTSAPPAMAVTQGADGRVQDGNIVTPGVVAIRNLTHTYRVRRGRAVEVFADIDISIDSGEFVSIVGPSGCGKSTLLKIVAGLIPPSTGDVMIDGQRMDKPRRTVAMMFQQPQLFPWRSALENTLLPVDIQRHSRKRYEQEARRLLDLVGLAGFHDAYPRELSGGMEQRVALSRTLMANPRVMLMDEPFGALDEQTRERMNMELLRIWEAEKKTVIFVTHNIGEAVLLSDRVLVMGTRPGSIVADLRVPLDRPRQIEMTRDEAYLDTVFAIRSELFQ